MGDDRRPGRPKSFERVVDFVASLDANSDIHSDLENVLDYVEDLEEYANDIEDQLAHAVEVVPEIVGTDPDEHKLLLDRAEALVEQVRNLTNELAMAQAKLVAVQLLLR